MALPAAPGSPTVPAAMPVAGQSGAPGTPPPGPTGGVTQPTQNRGAEVAGLTYVKVAVDTLIMALQQGLDAGSDPGRAAAKAINDLAKHVPPGSTSPALYNAALTKLLMQKKQEAPMLAALSAQGQKPPMPPMPGAAPAAGAGIRPAA